MKKRLDPRLKTCRVIHPTHMPFNDFNRAYLLRLAGRQVYVIVSDGEGWDHVSVSVKDSDETPTWEEMCAVKDIFFDSEETVIQYHPAMSQYVNICTGCLHLWRPQFESIPVPPIEMVY